MKHPENPFQAIEKKQTTCLQTRWERSIQSWSHCLKCEVLRVGMVLVVVLTGGLSAWSQADTTPPSTPGSFTVTSVGPGGAPVSWMASRDNVGVSGHEVYKDRVSVVATTSLSVSIVGLASCISYNFALEVCEAANNCSPWAQQVATTLRADRPVSLASVAQGYGHSLALKSDGTVSQSPDDVLSQSP